MARLPLIDPAEATGPAADLLTAVRQALGVTPNMTRAMANSPAVLKGYLELSGALAGGTLPLAVREQLALTVAEENNCDYCLAAHSYLATNVAGLEDDEVTAARHARATDPTAAAALRLAAAVTAGRGALSDADFTAARDAGLTDGQISEVIGHVALNVLTNYFNKAVQTDIDFPVVSAPASAR